MSIARPSPSDSKEIETFANLGDIQAQYMLALHLLTEGSVENFHQGLEWLRKAAESGHTKALFHLGYRYIHFHDKGLLGKELLKKSAIQIESLAQSGDVEAQHMLGCLYDGGFGFPQNHESAFKWFRRAAESGHIDAQRIIARSYMRGEGVEKDIKEGLKWCQKAADEDNKMCQFFMGVYYMLGWFGVEIDRTKAVYWLTKSVNKGYIEDRYYPQNGYLVLLQILILDAIEKRPDNPLKALALDECNKLLDKAKADYIAYQRKIINPDKSHLNGWFEKSCNDYSRALDEIREALEGNGIRLLFLAKQIYKGLKVIRHELVQNQKLGIEIYCIAARKGNTSALLTLIDIYLGYDGDEFKDLGKAEQWLNEAKYIGGPSSVDSLLDLVTRQKKLLEQKAQNNDPKACFKLAKLEKRTGNLDKAISWFRKVTEIKGVDNTTQARACYGLGKSLLFRDPKAAGDAFHQSILQRDIRGNTYLGFIFENGLGVVADLKTAKQHYKKACREGNILAEVFLKRIEFIERLESKANAGDLDVQMQLAKIFQNGVKDSLTQFENAKKHANTVVRITDDNISLLCLVDPVKSIHWYRKAAEQKDPDAQLQLANGLSEGVGCAKDDKEATRWYQEAAESGNIEAQEKLGQRLQDGIGCVKDIDRGAIWLCKAAENKIRLKMG